MSFFIVYIVIPILISIFLFYLLDLKLKPIFLDQPKLKINNSWYRYKENEDKFRFECDLLNEGNNPIATYYVYILNKIIYKGGFINSHDKATPIFSYNFDINDKNNLIDPEKENLQTFIYKDTLNNWYFSQFVYFYGINAKSRVFAKRIYLWDWYIKFKDFEKVFDIRKT